MNILVLSHVGLDNSYGAATSIRLHIESLESDVNFSVCEQGFSLGQLPQIIVNDTKLILPISGNYLFYKRSYISLLYYSIRNVIAYITKKRILKIIEDHKIEILHINSLVMVKLIGWLGNELQSRNVKIISHVREVLNEEISQSDMEGMNYVEKFICIDSATKKSLLSVFPKANVQTITNPVRVDSQSVLIGNRFSENTVFALVGINSEDKGTEFVCQCFAEAARPDSVLILAGKYDSSYAKGVYSKFSHAKNIVFLGDVPNLLSSDFYLKIDALVRAEHIPCIGRTVMESIYSGKPVFLPGNEHNYVDDDVIMKSPQLVNYYSVRSSQELKVLFKSFDKNNTDVEEQQSNGNIKNYRSRFLKIYGELIK